VRSKAGILSGRNRNGRLDFVSLDQVKPSCQKYLVRFRILEFVCTWAEMYSKIFHDSSIWIFEIFVCGRLNLTARDV